MTGSALNLAARASVNLTLADFRVVLPGQYQ